MNEKRVAVITGASRGIGAATARLAAARGYAVAVNYRSNSDAAESVVGEIRSAGGYAAAIQADVSDEEGVLHLFESVDRSLGTISALVNNAGILETQMRVTDMTADRLNRILKVNVTGSFLCAREAIRRMSTRSGGSGGAIVNVSSGASRLGAPGEYVDYAASKGAIDSMTIGLSKEIAEDGVRVNAVRPGFIYTDIHASGGEPNRVDRVKAFVPMKRGGTAEEVSHAIMWLLSDEASYITGSIIDITGGDDMNFSNQELNGISNALIEIAERAGEEILSVYSAGFDVRIKSDSSPVTDADERSERLIIDALKELAPDIPVIAEESVAQGRVPDINDSPFFLVDPLDGTKEFVNRNGEFTVNIALVDKSLPIVGVVHVPVLGENYWCDGENTAWRRRGAEDPEPIRCRIPDGGLVVVASRSHRDSKTDQYLEDFDVEEQISAGSSVKFCRVAEGAADLYPRLGRTMEWDVAAGHAVVNAAGGTVTTLDDQPLTYGKPGFANPYFVVRGASPAPD